VEGLVPMSQQVKRSQSCCAINLSFQIDEATLSSMSGRLYSVKRLSEKFSSVHFSEAAARAAEEDVLFENKAFNDGAKERRKQQTLEMRHVRGGEQSRQCI